MTLVHDFRPIAPTDPGYHWGSRRRICRYCHVGEDHVDVDICPVVAAHMEAGAATPPAPKAAEKDPVRTPYTQDGLRQFDHLSPEEAVAQAWTVPGTRPDLHLLAQLQLRDTMPVLHRAILRIVEQVKEEEAQAAL